MVKQKACRSDTIKKGLMRAPHRAFMHALQLYDADIGKPFVAVIGHNWGVCLAATMG
jgi:dihydroxyacid dehydratase/phosphogluconate dehydratase